jgi:16S rRNA A1518/A1519 N6-dimethyltransferase RsmA/KsgA/DIM1 with predicted DNA glycosylase/AP lyase activity
VAAHARPARAARGQHSLRSSRLAAELVRAAGVESGDLVVELGAGTGVITRPLAATGADVIAVELDPGLASQLRRRFAAVPRVTVVEGDALHWSWPRRPFAVVSNLPFADSGAILGRLFGDPRLGLKRADVIVQWEFACKHAAVWPATLKATYWRAWYEIAVTGRLARTAFSPTPSVDAAVLRVTRRAQPLVAPLDHRLYWRFLSNAFRANRQIRASLSPQLSARHIKRLAPALGFALDARPRDLDARQWAALFSFVVRR